MTGPPGDVVGYSYDQAGRLAELASVAGTFRFEYDSLGRRSALRYPHGASATYAYNSAGRLVNLTHRTLSGEVIDGSSYTLDPVGNRLTKQTPERTRTYQYDALYRLLEEVASTPGWSTEKNRGKGQGQEHATYNQREYYTYDPVGNRLTSDPNRTYSYNAANQLLSMNGASYSYDANGNLVAKTTAEGTTYYAWDYENRLTRVSMPDGTIVAFNYDPFGRRIEKSVNGQSTRYFYDSEDILFEYDGNGAVGNGYVHGPGIDEPLALINNKSVYYYHADGLGSIVAMTDTAERVVQTYEYNSFGHLKDQKNRIKQPFMFTGREWDRETGLYFYRARYYDAEVGRFISRDPLGCGSDEINWYAYAEDNAINFIDPTGMASVAIPWGKVLPVLPAIAPLILSPTGVAIVVGGAVLLWPTELDDPNECPMTPEQICDTWLTLCMRNPWQPEWNQKTYGKKKDCRTCYRRCLNNDGNWPFEMCPAS